MLKTLLLLINDKTPISEPKNHHCMVCAAQLSHGGVKFTELFTSSTFNLNHQVKIPQSKFICSHCAVFFGRKNWVDYCTRNNKNSNFPAVADKKSSVAHWMFFSHYFAKNDHRIVTSRQDWRDYLCNPPQPPFCYVLSTLCKKHLIFQSEIAYDRNLYPIRFEDKIMYIHTVGFKRCLTIFEALYNQGLSKNSLKTGDYNSSALIKADKKVLNDNIPVLDEYRKQKPDYLRLCEFVGGKKCTTV